ncbi:MAG: type II toxin-antitoxin system VapC family toxin [candidate division KSB1 bacterium]|nr:type II toxin-antitoxin system VapC family toxin [candidate division KSB1 bacterium]MDZ7366125.1 type II toxin-antitoxin system VapC family toxin [candidate division KSB1 bacterium]MDZ7404233.1 type II toxin-antitoxin system VapC family toxin [candidate division KSB1 bacterium]
MARRDAVIDSSVIIQHVRVRDKQKSFFLRSLLVYEPHLSAISVYEIELGAYRAGRLSDIDELQVEFKIQPMTETVARRAAFLDANLIHQNLQIGTKDAFIAATCLVYDLPLLTVNLRHFDRVGGLQLIDLNTLPLIS